MELLNILILKYKLNNSDYDLKKFYLEKEELIIEDVKSDCGKEPAKKLKKVDKKLKEVEDELNSIEETISIKKWYI